MNINQFTQTGCKKPLALKYQTKWKLCWTPYCKFQEGYNYSQNYKKRDFFILKELKRADIQEDVIISLDDNHGICRRKTQLLKCGDLLHESYLLLSSH